MMSNKILVVCLMLSLSGVTVTQRQDFCQSFADNDFAVDYGFQTNQWSQHFLAIGSHYWQIQWTEDRARLTTGLSRTSPLLGKQFRTVFLTNLREVRNWYPLTGRLYNNNTADWIPITWDTNTGLLKGIGNTEDYDSMAYGLWPDHRLNRLDTQFEEGFLSSVSLVTSLETLCFLHQTPVQKEKTIVFENAYHCFRFDPLTGTAIRADTEVVNDLKQKMDRKNITYGSDERFLYHSRDSEVSAVFSEFHFSDLRYLFLFKENKTLTYCLSSFQFYERCETEPEILISCSDYEKSLPPIEGTSDSFTSDSISSVSNDWSLTEVWITLWRTHYYCVIVVLLLVFIKLCSVAFRKPKAVIRNQNHFEL